jgi:hypothetical protein
VPPILAPLMVPQAHRSFSSFYNDVTKDPLRARAAAVVQRFDAGANALRADDLMQTILGSTTPNKFLCCTSLHATGGHKIYILHALSRFPVALDGTTTPWDNRIFCCLGEVLQDTVMTVAIPATTFETSQMQHLHKIS